MLVQEIVVRHPHLRLVTAQTALVGFDLAQSHRPDWMLLDIHLPDMSGYALLAKLRAQATTRSIPAVAVTANAMPGEADKARAAGLAAFVTKPLNVAGLDALLRELLGRKSAQHCALNRPRRGSFALTCKSLDPLRQTSRSIRPLESARVG